MSRQPAHSMSQASSVRHTSFTSGPLQVALILSPQGQILSKRESVAGRVHDWAYAYDGQGRLSRAELNGRVVEEYAYGPRGERIADSADALRVGSRELRYDRSGQLVLAGRMRLRYDRAGRLAAVETPRGATYLIYGDNGGLEAAHLVNGLVLEYATDAIGRPLEKRMGGRVVERFHWLDKVRLGFWEDLAGGRTVEFAYGRGRVPRAARLEQDGQIIELVLGADQVGTVKAIATSDGHLIQHIAYDSFGNVLDLQGEELGLPIGFAGGVRDRHLGLVRFGHRDYDPAIGRFTAPDPLGDTGGDHDLWEYCVDDPVNAVDPEGLKSGLFEKLAEIFGPSSAEAATLVTDMDKGTTTFDPRPEDTDGKPFTIQTKNVVSRKADPGANDPFKTDNVRVLKTMSGDANQTKFGPDGAYIDTFDPRGRDIHGGGSGLDDPRAPRQGWKETRGCTRGQNEDVIELGKRIDAFQKKFPGVNIPYERKRTSK